MATSISIETSPGSGVWTDLTAYLQRDSMTAKFNTLDFELLDPPAGAVVLASSGPQQGVKLTDPAWVGTIASVMTSDPTDTRKSHAFWIISATNAAALPNDTAPFDLSDQPADATTVYQWEDGTNAELEAGTDWAGSGVSPGLGVYETEGAKSWGYSGLSVQARASSGAPNQTLGRCTVHRPGLRPGNQFKLTSLNQGYAAAAYQVTQVTVTWPGKATDPVFAVEFGDTPETLALWTALNAVVAAPVVAPPVVTPPAVSVVGQCNAAPGLLAMGGGIVTIASATFTISLVTGHTATFQVQGALDARMDAWDNYIGTPRRAVRAVLSGGLFTGTWQELPFGLARATYDLSSAIAALPAGTYTLSIQVDTQEYNQMRVYGSWAQVSEVYT